VVRVEAVPRRVRRGPGNPEGVPRSLRGGEYRPVGVTPAPGPGRLARPAG
jgi:hypothetical protein